MPSFMLVNIADEFADANRSAVLTAKSGSELLPYRLTIRPTTVGRAIGEFVCSGLPDSNAIADLVYPDGDADITDEEFDRRVELLIKQQHHELANAAEYVHEWTMEIRDSECGIRYVIDDGW